MGLNQTSAAHVMHALPKSRSSLHRQKRNFMYVLKPCVSAYSILIFLSRFVSPWLKLQSAPFFCQEAGITPLTKASADKAAAKKAKKARRKAAVSICTTRQPASSTAAAGHGAHARDSEPSRVSVPLKGSGPIREGSVRPASTCGDGAAAGAPECLSVEAAAGLPANSAAAAEAAIPAWQLCRLTKVSTLAGLIPFCSLSIPGTKL